MFGRSGDEVLVAATAGADDELAHAAPRRGVARGVLLGEAFVVVVVAVEHDVGLHVVERGEQAAQRLGSALLAAGEDRLVPVGEDALVGVLGQVLRPARCTRPRAGVPEKAGEQPPILPQSPVFRAIRCQAPRS